MNKNRYILLLVVIAVVVGLVLFFNYPGRTVAPTPEAAPNPTLATQPSPAPASSTQDISGWKTYRNEKYGFEFKHPSDWNIQEGKGESIGAQFELMLANSRPMGNCNPADAGIELTIWNRELGTNDFRSFLVEGYRESATKTKIGMISSYVVNILGGSEFPCSSPPTYFIELDATRYIKLETGSYEAVNKLGENKIISQILSTFKFVASQPQPQPSAASTATIVYADSGFSPARLTVKAGTTVTFKNKSSSPSWPASNIHPTHELYDGTSLVEHCRNGTSNTFDACREIAPGSSWSFKFDKVGSWKYHDHLNPGQKGAVVVQ